MTIPDKSKIPDISRRTTTVTGHSIPFQQSGRSQIRKHYAHALNLTHKKLCLVTWWALIWILYLLTMNLCRNYDRPTHWLNSFDTVTISATKNWLRKTSFDKVSVLILLLNLLLILCSLARKGGRAGSSRAENMIWISRIRGFAAQTRVHTSAPNFQVYSLHCTTMLVSPSCSAGGQ